jgi:ATP-dependent RNA helicase RhlE
MLDMGFLPDLRRILAHVPRKRQTLLFSATMPAPIRKLACDILRDPVSVQVTRVSSPAPSVAHWVYHVEALQKPTLLVRLLAQKSHTRALVFTRTKHGADKVVRQLERVGVPAAALHGNKSQGARTRALREFRSAQTPVLVATDIAARGLDVEDISHVINYDLTPEPETYVHRIGRTGRAGATGIAVSFCTSQERDSLRAIERLICTPLQRAADLPEAGALRPTSSAAADTRPSQPRTSGSWRKRSQTGWPAPGRGSRRKRRSPVAADQVA